jgi:putative glutamine amidotransferase
MNKLIGISPRTIIEKEVEKQFVNTRYVKPLIDRGFNAVLLTSDNPNPELVLELCDAFLITGGSDIDPVHFQEDNTDELSRGIKPQLDLLDKQIVEHAHKHQKPMLGICRGHQAINIFMRGSLYQDLGEKVPTHEQIANEHIVHTQKNDRIPFDSTIHVNSYHHQAVKVLAPGFIQIASHEDGTCEAIIHPTLPIIGIQWHPEMRLNTKESTLIFDAFAKMINEST